MMKKDRKGRRKAGKGRRKRQGQEVERARVRWMTYKCISSLRLCNYVNQELTIKVKLICVVLLFFLLSNERVLPRVILILSSLYLYTYLLIYYLLQENSSQIHLSNSVLYLCLLFQKFSSLPSNFKRARGWKKLCRGDSHSLFLLCFSQISLHAYVRYYCGSHVIHRILKGIISIAVACSL